MAMIWISNTLVHSGAVDHVAFGRFVATETGQEQAVLLHGCTGLQLLVVGPSGATASICTQPLIPTSPVLDMRVLRGAARGSHTAPTAPGDPATASVHTDLLAILYEEGRLEVMGYSEDSNRFVVFQRIALTPPGTQPRFTPRLLAASPSGRLGLAAAAFQDRILYLPPAAAAAAAAAAADVRTDAAGAGAAAAAPSAAEATVLPPQEPDAAAAAVSAPGGTHTCAEGLARVPVVLSGAPIPYRHHRGHPTQRRASPEAGLAAGPVPGAAPRDLRRDTADALAAAPAAPLGALEAAGLGSAAGSLDSEPLALALEPGCGAIWDLAILEDDPAGPVREDGKEDDKARAARIGGPDDLEPVRAAASRCEGLRIAALVHRSSTGCGEVLLLRWAPKQRCLTCCLVITLAAGPAAGPGLGVPSAAPGRGAGGGGGGGAGGGCCGPLGTAQLLRSAPRELSPSAGGLVVLGTHGVLFLHTALLRRHAAAAAAAAAAGPVGCAAEPVRADSSDMAVDGGAAVDAQCVDIAVPSEPSEARPADTAIATAPESAGTPEEPAPDVTLRAATVLSLAELLARAEGALQKHGGAAGGSSRSGAAVKPQSSLLQGLDWVTSSPASLLSSKPTGALPALARGPGWAYARYEQGPTDARIEDQTGSAVRKEAGAASAGPASSAMDADPDGMRGRRAGSSGGGGGRGGSPPAWTRPLRPAALPGDEEQEGDDDNAGAGGGGGGGAIAAAADGLDGGAPLAWRARGLARGGSGEDLAARLDRMRWDSPAAPPAPAEAEAGLTAADVHGARPLRPLTQAAPVLGVERMPLPEAHQEGQILTAAEWLPPAAAADSYASDALSQPATGRLLLCTASGTALCVTVTTGLPAEAPPPPAQAVRAAVMAASSEAGGPTAAAAAGSAMDTDGDEEFRQPTDADAAAEALGEVVLRVSPCSLPVAAAAAAPAAAASAGAAAVAPAVRPARALAVAGAAQCPGGLLLWAEEGGDVLLLRARQMRPAACAPHPGAQQVLPQHASLPGASPDAAAAVARGSSRRGGGGGTGGGSGGAAGPSSAGVAAAAEQGQSPGSPPPAASLSLRLLGRVAQSLPMVDFVISDAALVPGRPRPLQVTGAVLDPLAASNAAAFAAANLASGGGPHGPCEPPLQALRDCVAAPVVARLPNPGMAPTGMFSVPLHRPLAPCRQRRASGRAAKPPSRSTPAAPTGGSLLVMSFISASRAVAPVLEPPGLGGSGTADAGASALGAAAAAGLEPGTRDRVAPVLRDVTDALQLRSWEPTLAAGLVAEGTLVQVTPSGVLLASLDLLSSLPPASAAPPDPAGAAASGTPADGGDSQSGGGGGGGSWESLPRSTWPSPKSSRFEERSPAEPSWAVAGGPSGAGGVALPDGDDASGGGAAAAAAAPPPASRCAQLASSMSISASATRSACEVGQSSQLATAGSVGSRALAAMSVSEAAAAAAPEAEAPNNEQAPDGVRDGPDAAASPVSESSTSADAGGMACDDAGADTAAESMRLDGTPSAGAAQGAEVDVSHGAAAWWGAGPGGVALAAVAPGCVVLVRRQGRAITVLGVADASSRHPSSNGTAAGASSGHAASVHSAGSAQPSGLHRTNSDSGGRSRKRPRGGCSLRELGTLPPLEAEPSCCALRALPPPPAVHQLAQQQPQQALPQGQSRRSLGVAPSGSGAGHAAAMCGWPPLPSRTSATFPPSSGHAAGHMGDTPMQGASTAVATTLVPSRRYHLLIGDYAPSVRLLLLTHGSAGLSCTPLARIATSVPRGLSSLGCSSGGSGAAGPLSAPVPESVAFLQPSPWPSAATVAVGGGSEGRSSGRRGDFGTSQGEGADEAAAFGEGSPVCLVGLRSGGLLALGIELVPAQKLQLSHTTDSTATCGMQPLRHAAPAASAVVDGDAAAVSLRRLWHRQLEQVPVRLAPLTPSRPWQALAVGAAVHAVELASPSGRLLCAPLLPPSGTWAGREAASSGGGCGVLPPQALEALLAVPLSLPRLPLSSSSGVGVRGVKAQASLPPAAASPPTELALVAMSDGSCRLLSLQHLSRLGRQPPCIMRAGPRPTAAAAAGGGGGAQGRHTVPLVPGTWPIGVPRALAHLPPLTPPASGVDRDAADATGAASIAGTQAQGEPGHPANAGGGSASQLQPTLDSSPHDGPSAGGPGNGAGSSGAGNNSSGGVVGGDGGGGAGGDGGGGYLVMLADDPTASPAPRYTPAAAAADALPSGPPPPEGSEWLHILDAASGRQLASYDIGTASGGLLANCVEAWRVGPEAGIGAPAARPNAAGGEGSAADEDRGDGADGGGGGGGGGGGDGGGGLGIARALAAALRRANVGAAGGDAGGEELDLLEMVADMVAEPAVHVEVAAGVGAAAAEVRGADGMGAEGEGPAGLAAMAQRLRRFVEAAVAARLGDPGGDPIAAVAAAALRGAGGRAERARGGAAGAAGRSRAAAAAAAGGVLPMGEPATLMVVGCGGRSGGELMLLRLQPGQKPDGLPPSGRDALGATRASGAAAASGLAPYERFTDQARPQASHRQRDGVRVEVVSRLLLAKAVTAVCPYDSCTLAAAAGRRLLFYRIREGRLTRTGWHATRSSATSLAACPARRLLACSDGATGVVLYSVVHVEPDEAGAPDGPPVALQLIAADVVPRPVTSLLLLPPPPPSTPPGADSRRRDSAAGSGASGPGSPPAEAMELDSEEGEEGLAAPEVGAGAASDAGGGGAAAAALPEDPAPVVAAAGSTGMLVLLSPEPQVRGCPLRNLVVRAEFACPDVALRIRSHMPAPVVRYNQEHPQLPAGPTLLLAGLSGSVAALRPCPAAAVPLLCLLQQALTAEHNAAFAGQPARPHVPGLGGPICSAGADGGRGGSGTGGTVLNGDQLALLLDLPFPERLRVLRRVPLPALRWALAAACGDGEAAAAAAPQHRWPESEQEPTAVEAGACTTTGQQTKAAADSMRVGDQVEPVSGVAKCNWGGTEATAGFSDSGSVGLRLLPRLGEAGTGALGAAQSIAGEAGDVADGGDGDGSCEALEASVLQVLQDVMAG